MERTTNILFAAGSISAPQEKAMGPAPVKTGDEQNEDATGQVERLQAEAETLRAKIADMRMEAAIAVRNAEAVRKDRDAIAERLAAESAKRNRDVPHGYRKPPYFWAIVDTLFFPLIGYPLLFLCFLADGAHEAGNDKWAATFSNTANAIYRGTSAVAVFFLFLIATLLFIAYANRT